MSEDYEDDHDDSGDRTVSELEEVHSTLLAILSTLKSRTDFSGWLIGGFFLLLLSGWDGSKLDRWTDKMWYSFRYDAYVKDITVGKRPVDCDFLHAPLGSKGCEYEKRTNVFAAEQRRLYTQQATTPEEKQRYADQPNSVNVYWEKVED